MQNPLNAPRRDSPVSSVDETSVQSIRAWIGLMKSADRLLQAGLARQVGIEQAEIAFRRWHAERCGDREHLAQLALRLRLIGEE